MTEKIGGVEGTKLDVDFVDMERVSFYTMIYVLYINYIVHKLNDVNIIYIINYFLEN